MSDSELAVAQDENTGRRDEDHSLDDTTSSPHATGGSSLGMLVSSVKDCSNVHLGPRNVTNVTNVNLNVTIGQSLEEDQSGNRRGARKRRTQSENGSGEGKVAKTVISRSLGDTAPTLVNQCQSLVSDIVTPYLLNKGRILSESAINAPRAGMTTRQRAPPSGSLPCSNQSQAESQNPTALAGTNQQANKFGGKTLREVFGLARKISWPAHFFVKFLLKYVVGPFMDVDCISDCTEWPGHKVKLFGEVIEKFCPPPKKLQPGERQRKGVQSYGKKYMNVDLQMETSAGQVKVLRLKAFHDAVTRFKSIFKKGQRYIINGASIEGIPEEYKSTDCDFQAVIDASFVHQLSPTATVETPADEEITGFEPGRIPLINLTTDTTWTPSHYIEGKVLKLSKLSWTKENATYLIFIWDQTAVLKLMASGHKAKELANKGRIKLNQTYRIVKGNGNIVPAHPAYSASLPVEMRVGFSTKITQTAV